MIRKPRVIAGETWTPYTGPDKAAKITSLPALPKPGIATITIDSLPADGDTIDITVAGYYSASQTFTFRSAPSAAYEIQIGLNVEEQADNIATAINVDWGQYVTAYAEGSIVRIEHNVPGDGNDVTVSLTGVSWPLTTTNGHNGALDYSGHQYTFVYKDTPGGSPGTVTWTVTSTATPTNDNITQLVSDLQSVAPASWTVSHTNPDRLLVSVSNAAAFTPGETVTSNNATPGSGRIIGIDVNTNYLFLEGVTGVFAASDTITGTTSGAVDTIAAVYQGLNILIQINAASPNADDYIYVAATSPSSGDLLFFEGAVDVSIKSGTAANDTTSSEPFVRLYHPSDPVYWRSFNRPLTDLAANDWELYRKLSILELGIDPDTQTYAQWRFKSREGYVFEGPVRFKDKFIIESKNVTVQQTTVLNVSNHTITVNDGETGSGVSGDGRAGLIVDRGTAANRSFLWDEGKQSWYLQSNLYIESDSAADFIDWDSTLLLDINNSNVAIILHDSTNAGGALDSTKYPWGIGRTTSDDKNSGLSRLRIISFDTNTNTYEYPAYFSRNDSIKRINIGGVDGSWSLIIDSASVVVGTGASGFTDNLVVNAESTFWANSTFRNTVDVGDNTDVFPPPLGSTQPQLNAYGDIVPYRDIVLDRGGTQRIEFNTGIRTVQLYLTGVSGTIAIGDTASSGGSTGIVYAINGDVVTLVNVNGNDFVGGATVTFTPSGASGTINYTAVENGSIEFINDQGNLANTSAYKSDYTFKILRKDFVSGTSSYPLLELRTEILHPSDLSIPARILFYPETNAAPSGIGIERDYTLYNLRIPLLVETGYYNFHGVPLLPPPGVPGAADSDTRAVLRLNQAEATPTSNQSIVFDSARTGNGQALFWSRAVTSETARDTTSTSTWLDSRLGWVDRASTDSGLFFKFERGYDNSYSGSPEIYNKVVLYSPRVTVTNQPGLYGVLVNVNITAAATVGLEWSTVDETGFVVNTSSLITHIAPKLWAKSGYYRITIHINGDDGAGGLFIGGRIKLYLRNPDLSYIITSSDNWDGYSLHYDRVISLSSYVDFYVAIEAGTTNLRTRGGMILIQPA